MLFAIVAAEMSVEGFAPLDKPKKACYNSCIIKLHKETSVLWADASMKILSADYPFVFERTDGKETLVIAINPSSKECSASLDGAAPVLSQNTTQITCMA